MDCSGLDDRIFDRNWDATGEIVTCEAQIRPIGVQPILGGISPTRSLFFKVKGGQVGQTTDFWRYLARK